jgi:predicted nucleotidyltransferase
MPRVELDRLVSAKAATHLRRFRRDVERRLAGRVTQVVLFGSRARGDATNLSDYDVAVFVQDLRDRRLIDHALADTAYAHILAGVHIRPVSVPADFLEIDAQRNLAREIEREGVLVA